VEVIAVDVPIGFDARRADGVARAFLSGGASTVFTTPATQAAGDAGRPRALRPISCTRGTHPRRHATRTVGPGS
jgi:predicted RNase H-like nuclease